MAIRFVNPLDQEALERLTSERLLVYLSKLQQCEESLEVSDWEEKEIIPITCIVFKSSREWKYQYKLVKAVLANRKNVE